MFRKAQCITIKDRLQRLQKVLAEAATGNEFVTDYFSLDQEFLEFITFYTQLLPRVKSRLKKCSSKTYNGNLDSLLTYLSTGEGYRCVDDSSKKLQSIIDDSSNQELFDCTIEETTEAKSIKPEEPIEAKGIESQEPIEAKGIESQEPIEAKGIESQEPPKPNAKQSVTQSNLESKKTRSERDSILGSLEELNTKQIVELLALIYSDIDEKLIRGIKKFSRLDQNEINKLQKHAHWKTIYTETYDQLKGNKKCNFSRIFSDPTQKPVEETARSHVDRLVARGKKLNKQKKKKPKVRKYYDAKNYGAIENQNVEEIARSALYRFVEILQGTDPKGITKIDFKATRMELTFALNKTSLVTFSLNDNKLHLSIVPQKDDEDDGDVVHNFIYEKNDQRLKDLLSAFAEDYKQAETQSVDKIFFELFEQQIKRHTKEQKEIYVSSSYKVFSKIHDYLPQDKKLKVGGWRFELLQRYWWCALAYV